MLFKKKCVLQMKNCIPFTRAFEIASDKGKIDKNIVKKWVLW